MDPLQPFQEPVLKLWADDTLWSKFVAHDFWKAHHSKPDQKSANDVTLVLLKKKIQLLIINAASLQESLGVNFLDPVIQEDLLHRVAWGRRHLHRKLAGTEQEQKWKTMAATRIHSDWPKVADKMVSIGAWENFLVQFWAAGNSDGAKIQAQKRASKPEPTEMRTPTKTECPVSIRTTPPPPPQAPQRLLRRSCRFKTSATTTCWPTGRRSGTLIAKRSRNSAKSTRRRWLSSSATKIGNQESHKKLQEEIIQRTNGLVKLEGDLKRHREDKDKAVAKKNVCEVECKKWHSLAEKQKLELKQAKTGH